MARDTTSEKDRSLRIRFSERDPQQLRLFERIEQDKHDGLNVSALARTLFLRYYDYRDATGETDVPPFGAEIAGGNGSHIAREEQAPDFSDPFLAQLAALDPKAELLKKARA